MNKDILTYNKAQSPADQEVCDLLAAEIKAGLPEAENKIWHAIPVWFLDGNPVVGYSKLKNCIAFYSGAGKHLKKRIYKTKENSKRRKYAIHQRTR